MDRKEKVQLVAFRVLFDILLRHGLSAVTASTNDQNCLSYQTAYLLQKKISKLHSIKKFSLQ